MWVLVQSSGLAFSELRPTKSGQNLDYSGTDKSSTIKIIDRGGFSLRCTGRWCIYSAQGQMT